MLCLTDFFWMKKIQNIIGNLYLFVPVVQISAVQGTLLMHSSSAFSYYSVAVHSTTNFTNPFYY